MISLDRVKTIAGKAVTFVQGDFTEDDALGRVLAALGDRRADLVMSDMAPNMSGTAADQPRLMYLCELALDFAVQQLKPGGVLVIKVFQGEGFDDFLKTLRRHFRQVASRKPKSSRRESRELYLVARGFVPTDFVSG
mgnify:CR=1 FL=1